jgi:hypothetical protein
VRLNSVLYSWKHVTASNLVQTMVLRTWHRSPQESAGGRRWDATIPHISNFTVRVAERESNTRFVDAVRFLRDRQPRLSPLMCYEANSTCEAQTATASPKGCFEAPRQHLISAAPTTTANVLWWNLLRSATYTQLICYL